MMNRTRIISNLLKEPLFSYYNAEKYFEYGDVEDCFEYMSLDDIYEFFSEIVKNDVSKRFIRDFDDLN